MSWSRTCSCSGSTPTTPTSCTACPTPTATASTRCFRDNELAGGDSLDLPGLVDAAQRQVEAFDGPVHAVVGFWDFAVSTMVPILCERLGLRWASVEAVVKCEHKYWSRLEEAKVIDEIPGFGLLDLENPALPDGLGYPVWVKPVRHQVVEEALRIPISDGVHQCTWRVALATGGLRRAPGAGGPGVHPVPAA